MLFGGAIVLLQLLSTAKGVFAVKAAGSPVGVGSGATGGGDRTAIVPATNAELLAALAGTSPRVVVLNKVFDFTSSEGTITETGCAPWSCSPNPQQAINKVNYCNGQKSTTVTYYKAGLTPIDVGSNISILGQGSSAGIKGRGLRINGQNNVIVQNIRITDINQRFVWGGDALTILGSTNVWIDHNYFNRIGRQQLVMGYDPSSGVTVSNNEFDGRADYSPYCDGHAYWILLLVGKNDQITFINNYVHGTSGRGPHIGGTSGYVTKLHMVNNYFSDVSVQAIETYVGGYVVAEGNYFENVKTVDTGDKTGSLFAATSSSQVGACSSYFGRSCVANTLSGSGSLNRVETTALQQLSSVSGFKSLSNIRDPASAKSFVQSNAGVGKVSPSSSGGGNPVTTTKATATTKPASSPSPVAGCASLYGQCGGTGWTGPTCCSSGKCTVSNAYYSQCL
ncbi:putative pectin lyase precursor [Cladochytrium replicatum]|nr:putative pectin lyase precursor [Cladochytrium replicatum]